MTHQLGDAPAEANFIKSLQGFAAMCDSGAVAKEDGPMLAKKFREAAFQVATAFDAGVEAGALYHDGEAERIRQICQPLTLAQIDAIGAHDEAAAAIRALKRYAK